MSSSARKFMALVVVPDIPDDATDLEKERIARRRLVATTGRCPCGATLGALPELTPGTVAIVAVEHEPDCPARDEDFR
jgi:hypothetical protein